MTVSRKKAKQLTVSRKTAKILTVNRKSHYPIETLGIRLIRQKLPPPERRQNNSDRAKPGILNDETAKHHAGPGALK